MALTVPPQNLPKTVCRAHKSSRAISRKMAYARDDSRWDLYRSSRIDLAQNKPLDQLALIIRLENNFSLGLKQLARSDITDLTYHTIYWKNDYIFI